jgi:hypothetical protein
MWRFKNQVKAVRLWPRVVCRQSGVPPKGVLIKKSSTVQAFYWKRVQRQCPKFRYEPQWLLFNATIPFFYDVFFFFSFLF